MNNSNDSDSGDTRWLTALRMALNEFRLLNKDVTISQVITLLDIAEHADRGVNQRALLKDLGLSDSGLARIIALLGDKGDRGRPAWGLIAYSPNLRDRRELLLTLTWKGHAVLRAVRSHLASTMPLGGPLPGNPATTVGSLS